MKKKVPPLKKIRPIQGMTIDEVEKFLIFNANCALADMANQISTDIEMMYRDAVSKFYINYRPKVYKRTYSTYKASSNFDNMGEYKIQGNNYESGITVNPANIPGNPYYDHWGKNKGKPMNKEWVFWRTFTEGIHGILKHDIRMMNKRREKRFVYKRSKNSGRFLVYDKETGKRNIRAKGYITIKAPKAMLNQYYVYSTLIKDVSFEQWAAKQAKVHQNDSFEDIISIRTSPEKILNSKFRKYATKNNLVNVVTHYFERYGFSFQV